MANIRGLELGARKVVHECARVGPMESVFIVTDEAKLDIARAIAAVADDAGAEVSIGIMSLRLQDGEEPPKPIASAMKAADVIFTPVTISITHTSAIREACEAGARAVAMTGFTERMMKGGGIEADFRELKPVCERVAGYLDRGSSVRVTTPAGTDMAMSIKGRTGIAKTCIVEPGEFSPVPDIEATVSPIEGTASGVIVADASIPYLDIGVLSEPVRFTVDAGMIVGIEGGEVADKLRNAWKSMNDPNVYNVAELGIGLNPACSLTGEMLEDEGCWGTVHFGIGTSITLGGNVKASSHYDLLMHKTTIEINGEVILKDGELEV